MLFVLDRDGVINFDSAEYIKKPDEWIPIPNSIEAIALLNAAGHRVVIATNQAGIGRNLFTRETLQKIHEKMCDAVEAVGGKIDHIYFCPHRPDEFCDCRKPKPGLLHQIQRDYQIESHEMVFIGDSVRDFEAAIAASCPFTLVRTGNGREAEKIISSISEVSIFDDLNVAVKFFTQNNPFMLTQA